MYFDTSIYKVYICNCKAEEGTLENTEPSVPLFKNIGVEAYSPKGSINLVSDILIQDTEDPGNQEPIIHKYYNVVATQHTKDTLVNNTFIKATYGYNGEKFVLSSTSIVDTKHQELINVEKF